MELLKAKEIHAESVSINEKMRNKWTKIDFIIAGVMLTALIIALTITGRMAIL